MPGRAPDPKLRFPNGPAQGERPVQWRTAQKGPLVLGREHMNQARSFAIPADALWQQSLVGPGCSRRTE
jgi:hypothetical protein